MSNAAETLARGWYQDFGAAPWDTPTSIARAMHFELSPVNDGAVIAEAAALVITMRDRGEPRR